MILFSTFELLYSIYHAFSLKSLLLFDFTAYNFLIIFFLKLGKIEKWQLIPKCQNNCEPGLPRPNVKRRRAKKFRLGRNLQKIRGGQAEFWRRKWQPTPVFLPGEFHGQRSLVGYSPWGHKESDTTEVTEHARRVLSFIWLIPYAFGPTLCLWPLCRGQEERVGGKNKSLDIFLEVKNMKWILS